MVHLLVLQQMQEEGVSDKHLQEIQLTVTVSDRRPLQGHPQLSQEGM